MSEPHEIQQTGIVLPFHRRVPEAASPDHRQTAESGKVLWSLSGTKATDPEENLKGMAWAQVNEGLRRSCFTHLET